MLGCKNHIKEFSFCIEKSNKQTPNLLPLEELLKDINLEDYYIIKATNKFRFVSIEELKSFKFASYFFTKKDKYDIEHIHNWLIMVDLYGIKFLTKPFPNFDPDKIK